RKSSRKLPVFLRMIAMDAPVVMDNRGCLAARFRPSKTAAAIAPWEACGARPHRDWVSATRLLQLAAVLVRALLFALLLGLAGAGALPPPAAAQGRPPCASVVRQIHRTTGHNGGGKADADVIARKLKT